MEEIPCRFCEHPLETLFADLGLSPLANHYVLPNETKKGEFFFPLRARVCSRCFLVQLDHLVPPEHLFHDYPYASSCSRTWLAHCATYAEKIIQQIQLNENSLVVEIASNDGYLLQYFQAKRIPVLGIEPALNLAKEARAKGISTRTEFFTEALAQELIQKNQAADLIIANNVLAHAPNLNDFLRGIHRLLKPNGRVTLEFPELSTLIENRAFDTLYHEHVSYFSATAIQRIFSAHGFKIIQAEKLLTHGGSLRIHAMLTSLPRIADTSFEQLIQEEQQKGFQDLRFYSSFQAQIESTKYELLSFLITQKKAGKIIAAYGAPAKGNTLLNYCGIKSDLLAYTVDKNPNKQHKLLPGTEIPVYPVSYLREQVPDYLWILPWNLKEEIIEDTRKNLPPKEGWITCMPRLEIHR